MTNFSASTSFGLCLLLLVLGLNRGFDLSDEGLYVLLADPNQSNEAGIINYDLFFKLLFQITGYTSSILDLRIFRLLGYLSGAVSLVFFIKKSFAVNLSWIGLFFLSALALFSGYAFLPPTLSYNSISVVLGCYWLFVIFSDWSFVPKSLAIGLILGIMMYVKVTTAIVLFPITIFLLLKKDQFSLMALLIVIVPYLIFESVFMVFLGESSLERMMEAIPLHTARPGYSPISLIKSSLVGLFFISACFFLGFLLFKVKNQTHLVKRVALAVFIGAFFFLSWITHITEEWNHLVMLATAILLSFLWFNYRSMRFFSIEELTLLSFPFILHFGSNVYWLRIGIHYWVFWLILIIVYSGQFVKQVSFLVSVLSFLLLFNGVWLNPFEQNRLDTATENWEYQPGRVIRLDKKTVLLLEDLKSRLDPEEKLILAAYRIPGMAYLLGKTIPFNPVLWDKTQLEKYFPNGYSKVVLYQPLDKLPDDFTGEKILINYSE
jgi:hypothetical protein